MRERLRQRGGNESEGRDELGTLIGAVMGCYSLNLLSVPRLIVRLCSSIKATFIVSPSREAESDAGHT
jgi:hypothetical protein